METFQIRTDLALEARESVNEEESKLRGVSVDEHYEEETDIRITKVTIDTKNAEKTLGKPMGVYVTMEAPAMVEPDDDYHREISEALAEELLKMMPGEAEELSVLIVGLGNREVTADALGPQVVDNGVHVVTGNETQVGGTGNKLSGDQVTVPVNLLQANQLVAAP